MKVLLSVLFTLFISSAVFAEPTPDPATFQVETIQMKLKAGKSLGDLLALRKKFSDFAKSGQLNFSERVLVPWAVKNAALPDSQDWDAIWVGFAPNTKDYANALSYYLKNGEAFNSDFDAVITNFGTNLLISETVFSGELAPTGETGVVLFRTCELKAGQTMDETKSAMLAMSETLKAGGSKGGTYFWNSGPGSAPSMEDSFLITRWFSSVGRVMDCSAFRMYLDYPFYGEG